MISCFRFRKLLLPYSEGALDRRKSEAVRRHVSACGSCAGELAELQSVLTTLRAADIPAAEPAPDLRARVEAAITEPEQRTRPWWQVRNLQMASAAGIAVVMLFAVLAVHVPTPPNDAVSLNKRATRFETGKVTLSKKPRSEAKAVVSQSKTPSVSAHERMAESVRHSQVSRPAEPAADFWDTSERKIGPAVEAPKTVKRVPAVRSEPDSSLGRAAASAPTGRASKPESNGRLRLGNCRPMEEDDKFALQIPVSPKPAQRAPYSQIARAPGGSQVQVVDRLAEGETLETGTPKAPASVTAFGAPAAPVAGALPEASVGGPAVKQKADADAQAKVAVVPPSVAGSAINVAPSLPLGTTTKGVPLQKPKEAGSRVFGYSGAARGDRPAVRATAADELVRANEQALASHPDSVKTMRWLADAYKRRGQVDKQIGMLEHVARLCPIDAQNWLSLGEAYQRVGKKDRARDAYKKASAKGSERIRREAEEHLKRLGS